MHTISCGFLLTRFSIQNLSWKQGASSGALCAVFWGTIKGINVAKAKSNIEHAIDEILNHAIWETVGHFAKVGKIATFLGALLTFQELGEKDIVYIPRQTPKPTATMGINPANGKLEHCIILENGRKLFGEEILKFYQSLQFVQFLPKYEAPK